MYQPWFSRLPSRSRKKNNSNIRSGLISNAIEDNFSG
jgi:hypothetical protein